MINMLYTFQHDTNVAAILNGLKVYDGHHPSYCSCVMIELHEMSDKSFGIQLYYQKQVNEKPHLLKIPGVYVLQLLVLIHSP